MASNNMEEKLWEIAQQNSKEEIDKESFENSLAKNIYSELEKSLVDSSNDNATIQKEYDETLKIILSAAKNNPDILGRSEGSSFKISNQLITKAVKTSKERVSYNEIQERIANERNVGIKDDLLSAKEIDSMIKNYMNLEFNEKNKLWNNYENLSASAKDELYNALDEEANKISNELREQGDEDTANAIEDINNSNQTVHEAIRNNSIDNDEWRKIIPLEKMLPFAESESVREAIESGNVTQEVLELYDKLQGLMEHLMNEAMSDYSVEKFSGNEELFELFGMDETLINALCSGTFKRDLYSQQIMDLAKNFSERNDKVIEYSQSKTGIRNPETQDVNVEEMVQTESKLYEEIINATVVPSNNETKINLNYENALDIYKEYFASFNDEIIETIKDMSVWDVSVTIMDDFNTMLENGQIDNETKSILDMLSNNMTENTKSILLDPQKREAFFEKIQSELTSQKDRESITDSEITEMFERASVDLQVAPFEPVREEDFMPPPFNIPTDVMTAIGNPEMDTVYLTKNEPLEVDEGATRAAIEAQSKGEDVQEAIDNYYREQQAEKASISQEHTEEKGESEEEKLDSIPEIVVVDETQENIEQDSSLDGNSQMPEELANEAQSRDDTEGNKQNENFVVLKKGKDGNLQVLRPIQFLKKSGVTLEQVEEEYTFFKEAVKETIRVERESSQNNENNVNLQNEDVRE